MRLNKALDCLYRSFNFHPYYFSTLDQHNMAMVIFLVYMQYTAHLEILSE